MNRINLQGLAAILAGTIATGCAVRLPPTGISSALESHQNDGSESIVSDLIDRIKSNSTIYQQSFKLDDGSDVPGIRYEAIGYNTDLKSQVAFLYLEFGRETVLKTIIMDTSLTQQAVFPDGREGTAYLAFTEIRTKGGLDGKPENISLYAVVNEKSLWPGMDFPISIGLLPISKDKFERMYESALKTGLSISKAA